MINEGARILEDGIALRAGDIDLVYVNGYGFPNYRGGPMWYADMIGPKKVYARVCEFRERHGELWEPAPLQDGEGKQRIPGLQKEKCRHFVIESPLRNALWINSASRSVSLFTSVAVRQADLRIGTCSP